MREGLFTLVFGSAACIVYLGFIIHILYIIMRHRREQSRGIRRSRSPVGKLVIYDVVFLLAASILGFGLFWIAQDAIKEHNALAIAILTIFFTILFFAIIIISLLIGGLTKRYAEVGESRFISRNKVGRIHKIPFSDVAGYSFRPFALGLTGPPPGGHLRLLGKTGQELFAVQVRSTPEPDHIGQYVMFRTVQGRWPESGNQEDEQVLENYTAHAMIPFYQTYYWRSDF